ncbi:hypothetical protein [Dyella sp. 2HG41-7]|uniref:hypothetical protein n=1 Tax=Dyella sp. 2HG41-7 TaxID=2883239 RepID=UPI001F371B16|nr:hypothetical protein [Dyella sp. 2HG41-7]
MKQITGKSDERLDEDYLPHGTAEGARLRFFQRVRSLGSDPSVPRKTWKGESVFDRVHASGGDPNLDVARDAFHSKLWSMLAAPTWTVEDYQRFIDELIQARGWYRASVKDRQLGRVFFRDDPAFGQSADRDHVYSTMLTHLESHPSADHVALLAALFREALGEVALETALQLSSSLRACTSLWLHAIELPDEVRELVQKLVEDRLVRNSWKTPNLDQATQNQRQYVKALTYAHLKQSPYSQPQNASFPIVLPSPRLKWLAENRELLELAASRIGLAQQSVFNLVGGQVFLEGGIFERDEWEELMQARQQQAQAWRQVEQDIRDTIRPPPRDTRFCLPVKPRRGSRSHNRARPYLVDGSIETED